MKFNEQIQLNKDNQLSQPEGGFEDGKGKETMGIDQIIKEIENIEKDTTLTSIQKTERTERLLENLKAQESLWQELSPKEKEIYKSLNPEERRGYLYLKSEERNKYLHLKPEERSFYLNYPQLRDRLLEGGIKLFEITIGSKSKEEIEKELEERNKIEDYDNPGQITFYDSAKELLNHQDFKVSPEKKELKLIKLSVADLGFPEGATWEEIIAKGQELGLELCPPETGPLFRLDYQELMGHDQPKEEYVAIAMNSIVNSGGYPQVFSADRGGSGKRYLGCGWAEPGNPFGADCAFLFVRK